MSESKPLVSIITVCKNEVDSIERTLVSVLEQRYEALELIVIDGLSQDGTKDKIQKYADRITKVVFEADKGIYDAMNKGIECAKGDWFLFLGADDVLTPAASEIFETLVNYPNYGCVFGDIRFDDGHLFKSHLDWTTRLGNRLHHQGVVYSKACFDTFRYDVEFSICSDYELNLMLYQQGSKFHREEVIVAVCGSKGVSRTHKDVARREIKKIRARHVPLAFFYSGMAWSLHRVLDFKRFCIRE